MRHLGTLPLLGVLSLGLLAGCGGADGADGADGAAADRERLDRLATTVDGLAAELVPATEHAARSDVHSWQGDYRVCSDPTSTDVSYVVSAQLDALTEPRGRTVQRLAGAFQDAGWEVGSPQGAVLTATRDGVKATVVIGRAATDLDLETDCVEVSDDVGKEYGDRRPRDFLQE